MTEATADGETAGVTVAFAELPAGVGPDYGEVFTRRWIVELILDLVGYTPERDLGAQVLVEPSCGSGAFLVPIVDRLVASALSHGRPLESLAGAVRAIDLLEVNAELARKAVRARLEEAGLDPGDALRTSRAWVTAGDFLLVENRPASADFVVGNPPLHPLGVRAPRRHGRLPAGVPDHARSKRHLRRFCRAGSGAAPTARGSRLHLR